MSFVSRIISKSLKNFSSVWGFFGLFRCSYSMYEHAVACSCCMSRLLHLLNEINSCDKVGYMKVVNHKNLKNLQVAHRDLTSVKTLHFG